MTDNGGIGEGVFGLTVSREGEVVISVHKPSLREKLFFLLSGVVSSVPLTLFVNQFVDSLVGSLSLFYAVGFCGDCFSIC